MLNQALSLLLYMFLEPEFFPLRKSLEWLGENICRSQSLDSLGLRKCVREVGLRMLYRSIDSGDLVSKSMEHCLHWVFTFSSMFLLDRELSWLDDCALDPDTGVWVS